MKSITIDLYCIEREKNTFQEGFTGFEQHDVG